MNASDLEPHDTETVICQRPIIDPETGQRTGWADFEAPRHVAEKQLAREHKITGWHGARLKTQQEETGEQVAFFGLVYHSSPGHYLGLVYFPPPVHLGSPASLLQ